MKNTIPAGLELVTDPKIINLFPPIIKKPVLGKEDYTRYEELQADAIDKLRTYKESVECSKRKPLAFDVDEPVKHEPVASEEKCTWGNRRLARFISRYVHFYKKKSCPDRDFILAQLRSVAEENNVKLPSAAELDKRQPKKRLVVEQIDENRYRIPDLEKTYKAYYDGENIVAYLPGENKSVDRELRDRTKWDDLFDVLYPAIRKERGNENLSDAEIRSEIENELIRQFYDIYDYDDKTAPETCPEFISRKLYNKSAAYAERKKRFFRKKDQVRWTAWWTITYDENKFRDELHFKATLLNKFRNLCNNKKWRIMGVFEHGKENGRLHFHGFFYIPYGSEVGKLVQKKHFSTKDKCWYDYIANTEFAKKFGINEYEDITLATQNDVNAFAKYTAKMLHYMEKGEKIYYSRYIPTEFDLKLSKKDMLIAFNITCKRKIKRYVVRDSVIVRLNTEMRTFRQVPYNPVDPYDNGLLNLAA